MEFHAIKLRIVEKMARKEFVGASTVAVDDVTNWLPSHAQGDAKDALNALERKGVVVTPRVGYVRLSSMENAVEWIESHDGDVPFNAR
ncbi:hypothetical protein [Haloferax sulfurifontis]|nr:hypothetical protein [Haloferax sulfurifontis]ELZ96573.1 hypothetical protein C441_04374 [Haloferax sulfurifontis ATCC BAA-897]